MAMYYATVAFILHNSILFLLFPHLEQTIFKSKASSIIQLRDKEIPLKIQNDGLDINLDCFMNVSLKNMSALSAQHI